LFLALPLAILLAPLTVSSQTGSSSGSAPASGSGAPSGSTPSTETGAAPSQPSATPAAPAQPTPPPFVPPAPPGPSQSHVPGAFSLTTPLTSPTALFEFHPTFGFTEEYTDNFRLSNTERTSNFRSTLRAGFNLLINTPKTQGTISTSAAVSRDSSGDEDTNFFPTITGTVRHVVDPRLSFTVTDSFTRNDDPAQGDQFGLRRERRTFTSNSFAITADWLIDIISTQSYYRNSIFFSEENTISHLLGVSASTRVGALNTLRAGYELSLSQTTGTDQTTAEQLGTSSGSRDSVGNHVHASFSRQIGLYGTGGVSTSYSFQTRNGSRVWNVSLFSSYGLPTGLSMSSSLGYSRFESDESGGSNALSTNTSISYRFTKAVVSLGISQDYRQTFVDGQDFGIVLTRSATGSLSYPLTPFINGSIFATYSDNEFQGDSGTLAHRNSTTLSAGLNLSWQILRWLSANLNYTYYDRGGDVSDVTGVGGGTENRVSLSLNAYF
jgi:hypothetical protein